MERENIVVDIDGNIMKYNKENPLRVTTLFSGTIRNALALIVLKIASPVLITNWSTGAKLMLLP